MQNQKSPGGTGPPQKLVLPAVRYHPSIQAAGGGASSAPPSKVRASQAPKTRRGRRGQTDPDRTCRDVNQKQIAAPHLAAGDRAPPTPQQAPLDGGAELDEDTVQRVEVLTRGQSSNPDWFAWRRNRITASVAHRIAHCRFGNGKSKAPPPSYLAAVTGDGPRVQTRAMSWGVQKEAEAVRQYQELKSAALGQQVRVQDCGLFVDARRPWLAASPDGVVVDACSGRRLLLLEVKCPYKHRHRRVEDACRHDPAFCLQVQDGDGQLPVYRLKTSHGYFTQVQVQLAVTGLRRADLVVYTLREIAVVPVQFDAPRWEDTVSKLERFYRDAVLPHVRQQTQQDAGAAGRAEP